MINDNLKDNLKIAPFRPLPYTEKKLLAVRLEFYVRTACSTRTGSGPRTNFRFTRLERGIDHVRIKKMLTENVGAPSPNA